MVGTRNSRALLGVKSAPLCPKTGPVSYHRTEWRNRRPTCRRRNNSETTLRNPAAEGGRGASPFSYGRTVFVSSRASAGARGWLCPDCGRRFSGLLCAGWRRRPVKCQYSSRIGIPPRCFCGDFRPANWHGSPKNDNLQSGGRQSGTGSGTWAVLYALRRANLESPRHGIT